MFLMVGGDVVAALLGGAAIGGAAGFFNDVFMLLEDALIFHNPALRKRIPTLVLGCVWTAEDLGFDHKTST